MNTESSKPPPGDSSLQFDRADFGAAPAGVKCAVCEGPISGEFFQANNQPICPPCRSKVGSFGIGGSGLARLIRAGAAGLVAAIAGFVIYWLVLTITHIEFGLLAIVVGWMVGYAVRWGAEGRGGLLYQLLAVALTYAAIASMYVPEILSSPSFQDGSAPFLVKLLMAFAISFAVPWLEGPSNFIGWIIIAFGLYQAWIMNRRTIVQISGPYQTQVSTPSA